MSAGVSTSSSQEQRIFDGGIPDSAQRRLAELSRAGLTSSFFGAPQFAVGLAEGVEPIGQVVGASVGGRRRPVSVTETAGRGVL